MVWEGGAARLLPIPIRCEFVTPKELTQAEIRAQLNELHASSALVGRNTDVVLMDYQGEYLESEEWKKIKKRILKRDGNVCARCGGRGTAVHHRSYEREVLEGKADHLLVTICSACHEVIHFDDSGKKRPFEEWEAILQQCPDPKDFPEPKIDLRRSKWDRSKDHPPQWSRMTEVQQKNWSHRYAELRKQKKDDLAKRKK